MTRGDVFTGAKRVKLHRARVLGTSRRPMRWRVVAGFEAFQLRSGSFLIPGAE